VSLCSLPLGGASLQEAVSSKLDDLFSEYMSVYAQVREERARAHALLKAGFFGFAEARHALPSLPLDATAYSGRDMLPTCAWQCRNAHEPDVVPADLSAVEAPVLFSVVAVELKDEEDDGDDEESKEEDGVRQRGGKGATDKDAAAAAASAAAATSDAAEASSADAVAAPPALDLRTSPLQWFGVLAPPSVSTAAASFRSSLEPLATVASLAQRLRELEKKFQYLSQLQQASHVDPAVEDELVEILEKIRISDEKKAAATAAKPTEPKKEEPASVPTASQSQEA
jgi:hypothetical protein